MTELLEAEGRLARRSVYRLAFALGLLIAVVLVFLTGVALLTASAYFMLRRTLPIDGALAVLGLLLIVMAGLGLGWSRASVGPENSG
ncbi:MAG: hypothetical protein ACIAXF_02920 [Phycisphaerales bacterium JB063]